MAAAAPTQMPAPHVDIDEVDLLEALNAALGIASYYDIYLATSEDDVDCRLCLFNVGSLETVVLWPALLFETVGDLTAQHKDYGPKGSEQKGRLTVFAHRLIRQRELSTSTAAFIFLLGKPDAESLVAVARDKVNEGGGLVFDFKANHQFMYGKAVRTMDTSLIKAFNIAIAKKEGLLARLKRDEENLMKYQQMCVDIFDRMSTNPTEDSCDESSCSVSSRSVSGSSSCHLSMIPIAGDDTSLQNMASSNSYSREATVVSRVLRCVSTSPSSTRRPITSYVMNSQPTDVESTVDHRRFVIPSPNTVSSASCCSPATVASDQHGISVSTDTVRCASPTSPLLASAHANANASECVCQDSGVIDRIGILQMNSEEELERAPIRELLLAAPNEAYRLRLPGRGSIQSRSFQTLCPRELLGAEVMNATLLKVLKPMLPKADDVYIFSSFFMSDLLRTGPNANGRSKPKVTYANVKNWDRSLKREGKILGMRVIFVPIDFQNSHWLFLRVFLPSFTIQLFDSQGVKPENRIYIEAMKEYLTAKMNESSIKVPADDCWTLVDESDRCPRQHNEYDSGLFVLVNITLLAQGIRLTKDSYTEQCFERHHTRERIAFLLWSNSTNMPFPIKNDPRRPMQTRQQTMRRLVFESSSMQMQPASTSTINTSATKALPATPATVGEGERKSVLSRKAVSRKVAWQSVFLSPMSDEFVCSVCENLVVSATQLGCCHAICCASCLHVGTHCPCCRNISSRSGAMHREDIDASLGDAIVLCPNNCGWTGVLNSLPNHHSICRADFYVTATSVQDYRMEDARVTYAMNQVQRLDLGEDITFRRKQSTRQNKDQGRRMHVRAATQARPHYVSVTNDATSRTSQLALAAALLVKLVRPYENVVNSISGKTFGGGVHQTFTKMAWIYTMDWIMSTAVGIFGDLECFRCLDLGCGLNLASFYGTFVDARMKWVGVEVDPNRCFLSCQIAIDALPQLAKLLKREISIGIIEGDGTAYLNLRGALIIYLWDRAFPGSVVFSTYKNLWRAYQHPFLLIQSICWFKERSPYLGCFFDVVKVVGISKHLTFVGSASGDSLVMVFVAAPKETPSMEDFADIPPSMEDLKNIPPLNNKSPSLFDILDSKFYDTASSLHQHKQMHSRLLGNYEKAKRGWKPRKVTTFDEAGTMVTTVLPNPK